MCSWRVVHERRAVESVLSALARKFGPPGQFLERDTRQSLVTDDLRAPCCMQSKVDRAFAFLKAEVASRRAAEPPSRRAGASKPTTNEPTDRQLVVVW